MLANCLSHNPLHDPEILCVPFIFITGIVIFGLHGCGIGYSCHINVAFKPTGKQFNYQKMQMPNGDSKECLQPAENGRKLGGYYTH